MMDFQRKKKLTNFTIGLIFLFSGVEYAVILPTIWAYLQILNAEPYFLGLGLSAFSFTGLLAGPIFGHWSDRTHRTKSIILFANLFEIAGNFMYFVGVSKWLLLASRLVAGIGTGAGAAIFGYLTRSTSTEDRATVFAVVMACRQAGLLIGPAFNLFLRLCNFRLGPFEANKYTSPGTMVTPLTQKYFGFGEVENSVMYCLCGIEVIAGFFFVRWLSGRFTDRAILAVGLVICNLSCVWGLVFLANPQGSFAWLLSAFIIGVFLQVLGLPFVAVSQLSLFSKVTAEKTQGFSQGLRRSVGGLATILGPLWAGGLTNNLYLMLGVMLGLLTLLTVMMSLSYSYLVEPRPETVHTAAQEESA
ncbi:uncharacterized protein MFSD8L1 [Latimeria chalumnae]|uniref:uncharacterized protein MFSD8L1 n=1 Tax=Latimeria chalumnae TaxID=7897 RepID=UPI00313BA777